MIKKILSLCLLLFVQSCEEVYKEEQFNVIVPVMVKQQENIKSEDQTQLLAQKNKNESGEQNNEPEEKDVEKVKQDAPKNNENNEEKNTEEKAVSLVKEQVVETKKQEEGAQASEADKKVELSSDFTKQDVPEDNKNSKDKNVKVAVDATPTEKPSQKNTVNETLDPREKVRRQWLELKNFASRRGFSGEDVNHLIPESLSIDNYIKFGDIEKTNEKLAVIESKLKDARVSRGYVKQKYRKISEKVATSQLTIDEKNDFNIRLKQVESAISENSFNSANRELNELEVDLGQVQTLDQVFEN
ncbi:hypothetical protein MRY82_01915 [bacterium]|nr:hypothetical protein [bacterium]